MLKNEFWLEGNYQRSNSYFCSIYNNWQSFNLSQWRTDNALKKVEDQLDEYRLIGKVWNLRVRTPNNEEYLCKE